MKIQTIISAVSFIMVQHLALAGYAQSPVSPVQKGSITVNAGIGMGNEYNSNYDNRALGTKAAIETAIWQAGPGLITLGAQVGGTFSSGGTFDDYKTRTHVVAGRSAWHHGWKVKGLDTYAGLSAGAGFTQYTYTKNEENVKQREIIPVFGGFIGASYFVTPSFGFNVEAGSDITRIQAGIIVKLK